VGLALYVAVYDLVAIARKKPTLSACWASHLFPSRHRAVLLIVWGGLTVHLFWPLKDLRRSLPVVLEDVVDAAVEAVAAVVVPDPEWELVKDDQWHWHFKRKT
jgi:hypothetical protein